MSHYLRNNPVRLRVVVVVGIVDLMGMPDTGFEARVKPLVSMLRREWDPGVTGAKEVEVDPKPPLGTMTGSFAPHVTGVSCGWVRAGRSLPRSFASAYSASSNILNTSCD